jgi:ATP-dependent Clp protease ATP-binding subunit ClpB
LKHGCKLNELYLQSGGHAFRSALSRIVIWAHRKCGSLRALAQADPIVTPLHIAFALLSEDDQNSRLRTVFSKTAGDFTQFERSIRRQLVRLPSQVSNPPLPAIEPPDVQEPPPEQLGLSPSAIKLLRAAQNIQKRQKDSYIAQDHIIAALCEDPVLREALKEAGVTPKAFEAAVQQTAGTTRVDSKNAEEQNEALAKYTVDLTELARKGDVDPVIGRDQEIRRTIRILSRRTKNNVPSFPHHTLIA